MQINMRILFLLTTSLLININVLAGGGNFPYVAEEHKNFLVSKLFTDKKYDLSIISKTNNLYRKINYNIYNYENDKTLKKLKKLKFSDNAINLTTSNILTSVILTHSQTSINFKDDYEKKEINVLSIYQFYTSEIINEFKKKNQLELLKYLMFRQIILLDSKQTYKRHIKVESRRFIEKQLINEIEKCNSNIKYDYAMLLIHLNLFNNETDQIINNYKKYFKDFKKTNVIAHSHFSGAVSKNYVNNKRRLSIDMSNKTNFTKELSKKEKSYEKTLYKENTELSVYLFSKLLVHPKLFRQIIYESSYVIDMKSDFNWDDCISYCKNQEEIDRINLIKISIFDGVNISLLNYFKKNTSNDSKIFETALTQSVQNIECNLFSPMYKAGAFKNNYSKKNKLVNKFAYEDAIELKEYLYSINIENKPLIHLLRGYTSFLLGNFKNATREYTISENELTNASYLSKNQKLGFTQQIKGLRILEKFSKKNSTKKYINILNSLFDLLENTYLSNNMESYFELGLKKAVKRKDFISALFFTSSKGYAFPMIHDIYMTNNDLKQVLKIINNNSLPFSQRHKKTIRLSIIEQIGTNYFRNDEFLKAKEYFDLLPQNFLPNESINNNYSRREISYFTFKINFSLSDTLNEKFFNKRTALDEILKIKENIKSKKIQLLETKNDIKSLKKIKKQILKLYYDLSCIYGNPFWAYSRIWDGGLNVSIKYLTHSFPFNILEKDYIDSKINLFLNKYGNINKSIFYLKKSLQYSNNLEEKAILNFKLYEKYKNPFLTSFHDQEKVHSYSLDSLESLIDSLYQNTNYYNEIIKECFNFQNDSISNIKNKKFTDDKKHKSSENFKNKYITYFLIFIISSLVLILLFMYFK
ncbi:MAG: hypothetical protein CMC04_04635 [Flavobacteriaceae bacterium]|nr:hypothetical protein [Flavobacteriaceae bacterium]